MTDGELKASARELLRWASEGLSCDPAIVESVVAGLLLAPRAETMRDEAIAQSDLVRRGVRRRFQSQWGSFAKCERCGARRNPPQRHDFTADGCAFCHCGGALMWAGYKPAPPRHQWILSTAFRRDGV